MRRLAYIIVFSLGVLAWLVSMLAMLACTWAERLAHRIEPDVDGGNCWAFALARYRERGGYLIVRASHSAQLLGWPVPHVMWAERLPEDMPVEHFSAAPEDRRKAKYLPWFAFWFRGRVYERESPR